MPHLKIRQMSCIFSKIMSHCRIKSFSRLSCRHFKWKEDQQRRKLLWNFKQVATSSEIISLWVSDQSCLLWILFLSLVLISLCSHYLLPHLFHSMFLTLALLPFSPTPGLLLQVAAHTKPSTSVLLLFPTTHRSSAPIRTSALNGFRR